MSGPLPARAVTAVALGELVADPASVIDRVAAGDATVVVTREGEAVAVVMGVAAYARLRLDCERLRLLALGELEAAAGDGHELADVLDDARALLAEN